MFGVVKLRGGLFPSEEALRVQIEPRLIVHKKVRCRRKPCVIPTFQAHNCENINVIAAPGLNTKANQCLSSSSNVENQHHRLSCICMRCVYKDIQMYAWLSQQSLTKLSIYVCINQVQQWLHVLHTDTIIKSTCFFDVGFQRSSTRYHMYSSECVVVCIYTAARGHEQVRWRPWSHAGPAGSSVSKRWLFGPWFRDTVCLCNCCFHAKHRPSCLEKSDRA